VGAVRSQVGRVVAAVAVVGAMVGGCGSGPSQAGSAVIIGSGAIPLATVQDDIATALSPDKAGIAAEAGLTDPEAVARYVVSDAVRSDLLTRRAEQEGIVVTDEQVDAALATAEGGAAAGSLYAEDRAREETRDQLTAVALGARYLDRLGVALQVAVLPTEDEAMATARALAEGGAVAEAALAGLPPDSRQSLEVTAAQALGQFPLYPFGTAEGAVVVTRPAQEGLDYEVVRIVEQRDLPAAGPSAVDQVRVNQLAAFGYQLLQPDATALGVRVNPRYGVWDPLQMSVVAEGETIGTVVPAADQR
jgi:hypothetical protein